MNRHGFGLGKFPAKRPIAPRLGLPLIALFAIGCATTGGAGVQFALEGDQYFEEGRMQEAVTAYDKALSAGYPERKVGQKKKEAQASLLAADLTQSQELFDSGAYQEALELILKVQKTNPEVEAVLSALDQQVQAWVGRAEQLRIDDDRAGSMRSLNRLESLYPKAPGAAEVRSVLVNEWTEVLLMRARQAEKFNEPASALLNWAILAGLNPEEPYFAEELIPLRQKLLNSLSVPVALYMGGVGNEVEGEDPETVALRTALGTVLADGGLNVDGVVWVERAFGELGPSATLTPIGAMQGADVERGPGVYRVLQSTENIENPEYLRLTTRITALEEEQQVLSRKMDQFAAAHRHSEGPSRTKMEEALARAQVDYDNIASELYDLQRVLETTPPRVESPQYLEMPIEDEMHIRAIEVTFAIELTTMDNSAPPVTAYVVGRGEEKDGLRMGDPGRGIPEDPLEFKLSDAALQKQAIFDGLAQAGKMIQRIPEEAAEKWLLHAERMDAEGDREAAIRSYVNHVILTAEEPGPAARKFLITEGLASTSLLTGR